MSERSTRRTLEETEKLQNAFKRAISKKEIGDGDEVATCGHVEPGKEAFVFDGVWKHLGETFFWLACCPACAEAANWDLASLTIVEAVKFGGGS